MQEKSIINVHIVVNGFLRKALLNIFKHIQMKSHSFVSSIRKDHIEKQTGEIHENYRIVRKNFLLTTLSVHSETTSSTKVF